MSSSEGGGPCPEIATIASDLLDALHGVLPFDRGTLELDEQVVATRGLPADRARSSIRVPLTLDSAVAGSLTLESREPDRYGPGDAAIAHAFARAAASAMALARCHEVELAARRRGELLAAATEAISATLDVHEIYTLILQQLRRVVPYDCASIQELQGDELVVLGGVGFPEYSAAVGLRFPVWSADAPNGEVVRRRRPVILDDAPRDFPAFRSGPPADAGIRSWIGVPLLFGDRVIGMLTVDRCERGFYRAEHAAVAVAYARRAAIAMEHARLYSAAQRELRQREVAEAALRETQAQVLHAQKMEAIGLLAGGVAHDFNNLLAVILACADVLRVRTDESDPRMRGIEEIAKAVDRASTLVRQLLAFGRKQVLSPQVLALGALVREMQNLFRRLLPETIELRVSVAEDLGRIDADPGQIEQVILNVVLNARDAMPDGGRLDIELANAELDADYARLHPSVTAGRYVMLAVTDTGSGMDAQTQARIFEPFFTTKESGKGSGLGLAMVYGVVQQSGGHIWVYSELGLGTTFRIYLPRVDRPEEWSGAAPARASEMRGAETVLLVEDDEALRTATHELLESRGYKVLSARDGMDALAIADAYDGAIDLLLTDVVMPGMNGSQLASRLMIQRPTLKVLYASGYIDATLHGDVVGRGATMIRKPFTATALAEKMREILDGPTHA